MGDAVNFLLASFRENVDLVIDFRNLYWVVIVNQILFFLLVGGVLSQVLLAFTHKEVREVLGSLNSLCGMVHVCVFIPFAKITKKVPYKLFFSGWNWSP